MSAARSAVCFGIFIPNVSPERMHNVPLKTHLRPNYIRATRIISPVLYLGFTLSTIKVPRSTERPKLSSDFLISVIRFNNAQHEYISPRKPPEYEQCALVRVYKKRDNQKNYHQRPRFLRTSPRAESHLPATGIITTTGSADPPRQAEISRIPTCASGVSVARSFLCERKRRKPSSCCTCARGSSPARYTLLDVDAPRVSGGLLLYSLTDDIIYMRARLIYVCAGARVSLRADVHLCTRVNAHTSAS